MDELSESRGTRRQRTHGLGNLDCDNGGEMHFEREGSFVKDSCRDPANLGLLVILVSFSYSSRDIVVSYTTLCTLKWTNKMLKSP